MTSEEFKKTLWDTANKLRGSVSAAEYKYPVLGLVFLKYVSDLYDAQADVIRARLADPSSELYIEDEELRVESASVFIEDKTFFTQDNVFWVPAEGQVQPAGESGGSRLRATAGQGHGVDRGGKPQPERRAVPRVLSPGAGAWQAR